MVQNTALRNYSGMQNDIGYALQVGDIFSYIE